MQKPEDFMEMTGLLYVITAFVVLMALLFIIFIMISMARRRNMIHEQERLTENFQQELLRSQLEIKEQTFRTISQEIHDNIGQVLSLARINLSRTSLDPVDQSFEKIETARHLIGKAIHDLRDLSRTLNTETIVAIGLLSAIESELDLIRKTGIMETDFRIEGTVTRLEPQRELILFRIVQEALHNVIKHAQSSFLSVEAIYQGSMLYLKISDNGKGFDTGTEASGSGLRNMRSRAALIGAKLWPQSSSDGTQIHISIPLIS